MQSKLKYAIILALITAVISGANIFLTKIAVSVIDNPVVFTFLKNIIVAAFLIGIIMMFGKWRELKQLNKNDIYKLAAIGIIGGSIPFILFFTGLKMVPAINAGFIHKTLFIWVALLAIPLLKERLGWLPVLALGLLFGGNLVLFGLPKFSYGPGEIMIFTATLFWAVENIIAKVALKRLSSLLVAGARMTLGSFIIFIVIAWQGNIGLLAGLAPIQWGWTLLTSALLVGYVLSWYTALKYAPATLVASLLIPATFVTNILTAVFITHTISNQQLLSGSLLIFGVVILISKAKNILPKKQPEPILSIMADNS